MHCRDHARCKVGLDRNPAHLRDAEARPEKGLSRRRAEEHEDTRLDDGELGFEPRAARGLLGCVGLLMDAPPATRLPLEVLHSVGDVCLPPVDPGFVHALVENPTGRADEGSPREILLVAGLLADEHDVGRLGAFAEHRLGRVSVEIAGRAPPGSLTEPG